MSIEATAERVLLFDGPSTLLQAIRQNTAARIITVFFIPVGYQNLPPYSKSSGSLLVVLPKDPQRHPSNSRLTTETVGVV